MKVSIFDDHQVLFITQRTFHAVADNFCKPRARVRSETANTVFVAEHIHVHAQTVAPEFTAWVGYAVSMFWGTRIAFAFGS